MTTHVKRRAPRPEQRESLFIRLCRRSRFRIQWDETGLLYFPHELPEPRFVTARPMDTVERLNREMRGERAPMVLVDEWVEA